MNFENVEELVHKLAAYNKVEATKKLTRFYVDARFRLDSSAFEYRYVDGKNDGGIDFYFQEDFSYYILQSKFSEKSVKAGKSEIIAELKKIKNTILKENPNKKAVEFVNALSRDFKNGQSYLEIIWLTTNVLEDSLIQYIQDDLDTWRKKENLYINIDFVAIDKFTLDSVIYDKNHGYVPHTGKKVIQLEKNEWIESDWEDSNVYSIITSINVTQILKWFANLNDIDKYLQKNVREFIGESSKINKAIKSSYLDSPEWFWYKHNGLIIFSDHLFLDKMNSKLILRNPQIVNGGQTIQTLYRAFDGNNRTDNGAKVLVRFYKLAYQDFSTYKRSIDIIAALNTQNKILPSDLRSTDPRQVRLENLFRTPEIGYTYIRKRSKDAKSSRYSITMRKLALRYYVCKKNSPREGVQGQVEELFEEEAKYKSVFNEKSIFSDLNFNHIVLNYLTCWVIDQLVIKSKKYMSQTVSDYFGYVKWYCLSYTYNYLIEWKKTKFNLPWQQWIIFLDSNDFERQVIMLSKKIAIRVYDVLPYDYEIREFLKSAKSESKLKSKVGKKLCFDHFNKAYRKFRDSI